ncbi:winged helix DNA-binding domain-containing protein [Nocardioides sp. NPDC051685]|uniref:winged helix DNA-binding domain-containing protein n=1 Tax=Nocardioides sp. NPDC051685 TaxID=3364334 RepID=UPI003791CC34
MQDSPPGSALLSLHARVDGISAGMVARAIEDRSMLLTWSMRGSPYLVPVAEASVYTTGVLPPAETALRHFVQGVERAVDRLGLTLTETADIVAAATREVLPGRQLAINELGAEVAELITPRLTAPQREVWIEEGAYAEGQPIGEAVVHFCVRVLALRRIVCFAARAENKAPFVLTEEWLGHPVEEADPAVARAELLRRYLRCYGPSTRGDFAAWLGVRAGDVDPWWGRLGEELVEVDVGRTSWILAADLDSLRTSTMPFGVRLLPPRDPYTQLRDRETIVDKVHHRDNWRTTGDPGTVLVDGEIIGTWRARKNGRRMRVEMKAFEALSRRHQDALAAEAESIALLRDASSVSVEVTTY